MEGDAEVEQKRSVDMTRCMRKKTVTRIVVKPGQRITEIFLAKTPKAFCPCVMTGVRRRRCRRR